MNNNKETLVVVLNESVLGSILKDLVTFFMFGGLMYFNHSVLDGNGWIDLLFIIMVFMYLSSRSSVRVFSGNKEDAIKWLGEKK